MPSTEYPLGAEGLAAALDWNPNIQGGPWRQPRKSIRLKLAQPAQWRWDAARKFIRGPRDTEGGEVELDHRELAEAIDRRDVALGENGRLFVLNADFLGDRLVYIKEAAGPVEAWKWKDADGNWQLTQATADQEPIGTPANRIYRPGERRAPGTPGDWFYVLYVLEKSSLIAGSVQNLAEFGKSPYLVGGIPWTGSGLSHDTAPIVPGTVVARNTLYGSTRTKIVVTPPREVWVYDGAGKLQRHEGGFAEPSPDAPPEQLPPTADLDELRAALAEIKAAVGRLEAKLG